MGQNVFRLRANLHMQANEKYSVPPFFNDKDEEIKKVLNKLTEENNRLQLENEQLKTELEREQRLHKNLYNEWKELKSGKPAKQNGPIKIKVKRYVRKRSSFYGLIAFSILLSAFIVYWAMSGNSGNNTISPPIPAPNPADSTAIDSISKNKVQVLSHKSTTATPTIKSRLKISTPYYPYKNLNSSYQKEPVATHESARLEKFDSVFPVS